MIDIYIYIYRLCNNIFLSFIQGIEELGLLNSYKNISTKCATLDKFYCITCSLYR